MEINGMKNGIIQKKIYIDIYNKMDLIIYMIISFIIIFFLMLLKPQVFYKNKKILFIKLLVFSFILSLIIYIITFTFLKLNCEQSIIY